MSPEKHSSIIPETPHNLKLREALTETLRKADQANIDLYLTGGTAAAVYGGENRPLSLDLDFFVHPHAQERIEQVFGGKFRFFGEKKLFKSNKLVGAASNGVDLDFIAEQNIVPDESKPEDKITLTLNQFAVKKSCESHFMDENVKVLPPECIVIAKLFAGRGIELNKYDLKDSEAVIGCGIIRPDIFKRAALEIAGTDEKKRQLVFARLQSALTKLTQTNNVKMILEAVNEMQQSGIGFSIELITDSTRRRTLPDSDPK